MNNDAINFDPMTGEPVKKQPDIRFDPMTGQPVEQSENVSSNDNKQIPDHYYQPYQQPVYTQQVIYQQKVEENVTLGEWFITFILMAIPLLNVIMLFVWACGSGTKPSKKTYAQLLIILGVVGIVVWFFLFMLGIAAFS